MHARRSHGVSCSAHSHIRAYLLPPPPPPPSCLPCVRAGIDHITSVRVVDDVEWPKEDLFWLDDGQGEGQGEGSGAPVSGGAGSGTGGGGFYITQLEIPSGQRPPALPPTHQSNMLGSSVPKVEYVGTQRHGA